MRIRDVFFVAGLAFGFGWTIAALVLEAMSAGAARSLLWLPFARLFLFLACTSFVVALIRELWRARRVVARAPWPGGAASLAAVASCVTLLLGNLHTALALLMVGLCALFIAEGARPRGAA